MEKLLKWFPFLGSDRFWALVLIGASIVLNDMAIVSNTFLDFVMTVAGGHIGIRTIDRTAEYLGKKK